MERKEPEASPARTVSCSTPRFPQQHLVLPSSVFWCILWGGGSRGDAALLPPRAWVRSARRPRSLQTSAPARSQGEARPANNQESKEPPARHGEPLPGRLQPLPALAAEPPSAAPGGGSRAAPQNPVRRCPRHLSSHEQDPDGWRGHLFTQEKTFFCFPLFLLLSTGSDDGAGLEAALGMPIFRGWAHRTLLAGSSPSQPAPEENKIFSPAFLSSAVLQERTP